MSRHLTLLNLFSHQNWLQNWVVSRVASLPHTNPDFIKVYIGMFGNWAKDESLLFTLNIGDERCPCDPKDSIFILIDEFEDELFSFYIFVHDIGVTR